MMHPEHARGAAVLDACASGAGRGRSGESATVRALPRARAPGAAARAARRGRAPASARRRRPDASNPDIAIVRTALAEARSARDKADALVEEVGVAAGARPRRVPERRADGGHRAARGAGRPTSLQHRAAGRSSSGCARSTTGSARPRRRSARPTGWRRKPRPRSKRETPQTATRLAERGAGPGAEPRVGAQNVRGRACAAARERRAHRAAAARRRVDGERQIASRPRQVRSRDQGGAAGRRARPARDCARA